MIEKLKPTPTEYMGVKFRSKSEAIFAFHLEEAGWHWNYESKTASEIHPWDFELVYHFKKTLKSGMFCCSTINRFVECKPSKPTESYIQNLREKILKHFNERILKAALSGSPLKGMIESKTFRDIKSEFFIVYGSPWSPAFNDIERDGCTSTYGSIDLTPVANYSLQTKDVSHPYEMDGLWGFSDLITERAMNYRFDLNHDID